MQNTDKDQHDTIKCSEETRNETMREKEPDRCREIEKSIIKRFRKEIWRPFVKALNEYDMIKEGDNIAVCISGGKDSMLLAKCMQEILRHGKMEFGLHFLVMDPGYNPANRRMIEAVSYTHLDERLIKPPQHPVRWPYRLRPHLLN